MGQKKRFPSKYRTLETTMILMVKKIMLILMILMIKMALLKLMMIMNMTNDQDHDAADDQLDDEEEDDHDGDNQEEDGAFAPELGTGVGGQLGLQSKGEKGGQVLSTPLISRLLTVSHYPGASRASWTKRGPGRQGRAWVSWTKRYEGDQGPGWPPGSAGEVRAHWKLRKRWNTRGARS